VADSLGRDGGADAVVEVESLAQGFPYPPFAQALAALPRVVALHRAPARTAAARSDPGDQSELDALLVSLGCSDTTVIQLDTPPGTGAARVTAREPADWIGLPQLLSRARELPARLQHLVGFDHVIDTHRSTVHDVAADVRRLTDI